MSLYANDNFQLRDGRTYVLVGSSADGSKSYIIDKYEKKAFPRSEDTDLLENEASVLGMEGTKVSAAARLSASAKSVEKAEQQWARIKDIVNDPRLLETGARWHLVQLHAKLVDCSPNTILSALRKYWQCGMSEDALLGYRPSNREDNGTGLSKAEPKTLEVRCRRGRPAIKHGCVNYHANALDHAHFRSVAESFYFKDERKSLTAALQELREQHYSYRDGNNKLFLRPAGEHPTLRQFTSYLKKHYPIEVQQRARKGPKKYELENRPVLGTVRDVCHGVGHIAEGDATIADVTLVSSLDRSTFIGRPTIYLMVDRESRLIIGWYIGLENASWAVVIRAFLNVAEDKEALCQRLGLSYDPADWVATGIVPEQLYLDRGEGKSKEAVKLGPGMGVLVTNLPSQRADWKAIVESRFHLTHLAIRDHVPGMNPAANAVKRRSVDFSLEGALTLCEFESILVGHFIAYNRTVMKSYPLTPDQIRGRVEPSPINLYRHGLRTRSGLLKQYSEDDIRLKLLPGCTASITELGISANGMFYKPESGVDRTSWFVHGRKKTAYVQVSYDPTRTDSLLVHDTSHPRGFFFANLSRDSVKFKGMSLIEAKAIMSVEDELISGHDLSKAQNRANANEHAKKVSHEAKKLTAEAAKGRSKTSRRSDTKVARDAERNLERDRNATHQTRINEPMPPVKVDFAGPNVLPLKAPAVQNRMASLARSARAGIFDGSTPL